MSALHTLLIKHRAAMNPCTLRKMTQPLKRANRDFTQKVSLTENVWSAEFSISYVNKTVLIQFAIRLFFLVLVSWFNFGVLWITVVLKMQKTPVILFGIERGKS